jgi:thiamine-phosphate pyrophosphorylase
MKSKVLRIIDANVNRAVEGLRVMEEVLRFVVESKSMTAQVKKARARIRKLANQINKAEIHFKNRKIRTDVGRRSFSESEAKRKTVPDVFIANSKRAQEALRVLEEFSKLIKPAFGKAFKTIRFKVYSLEKKGYKSLID